MIILGIDPGYDRLGIAIIEKNNGVEKHLYSTCFTTDKKNTFYERLRAVGQEVERVIIEHEPEALSIENLFFNTNQKTAMNVAETRGAIIHEAMRHGLTVHEYTPIQIKNALTGYGRATKDQVQFMSQQLLSMDMSKMIDDECDAIATALTHSSTCR